MKKNKKNPGYTTKIITSSFLSLLLIVVLFSLFLIIITQTSSFRHWAGKFIQEQINSSLEGRIEFSDFRINFLHGIEVFDLRVLAAGDTLATADILSVDFHFFKLFKEQAVINHLKLIHPKIKFIRSKADSSWNFEHIAKPDTDTTETPPFKWIIDIKNFSINNGMFILYDSLSEVNSEASYHLINTSSANLTNNSFDKIELNKANEKLQMNNLKVRNLNIELNGLLDFANEDFSVVINHLTMYEENASINIDNIKAGINANKNKIWVSDLIIKSDDGIIESQIELDNLNIFSADDDLLDKVKLDLELDVSNFDAEILKKFLDDSGVEKGNYDIKLSCAGKLNNLIIRKLEIVNEKSNLNISGNIQNLMHPEDINLNITINPSFIYVSKLSGNVPIINNEILRNIGYIDFNYLQFRMFRDSISINLSVITDIGLAIGYAGMNFSQKDLSYSAELNVKDFNIGSLINSEELAGKITSNIILVGKGTDLANMETNLFMQLQPGNVRHFAFESGILKAEIRNGGLIKLDTLNIEFNPNNFPPNMSYLKIEESNITSSGIIDFRNFINPGYKLNSEFRNVNIANLFNNNSAPQLFSGALDIEGNSFNIDSINGKLDLDVKECLFEDRALVPFKITLELISTATMNSLDIKSDYLNLRMWGNYHYKTLIPTIFSHGENIADYVSAKFSSVISDTVSMNTAMKEKIKTGEYDPINLFLTAEINDISPVSIFTSGMDINLKANINLQLFSDKNDSRLNIDSLSVSSFELKMQDLQINSQPIKIDGGFHLELIDSISRLSELNLNLKGTSDSRFNDLILTQPDVTLFAKDKRAIFTISSALNEDVSFNSKGVIDFEETLAKVNLNDFDIIYQDKYGWNSIEPVRVNINSSIMEIESFKLKRYGAEEISIQGGLTQFNEFNDLKIVLTELPISEFNNLFNGTGSEELQTINGNIKYLNILLNGSFDNTFANITSELQNLSINDNYIGNIEVKLNHSGKVLNGDIISKQDSSDKFNFNLNIISLPYNLSVIVNGNRLSNDIPIDIELTFGGFPLAIISPFIPNVEQLNGMASGKLKFNGFAPDDYDISGNVSIPYSSFIIETTNIKYFAEGVLDFSNRTIYLNNFILRNTIHDLPDGKAKVTGSISLDNKYNPSYIDLEISAAKFLVLSESSIKRMPYLYGNMIIATGDNPINFYGTFYEPNLTGDINILAASLKMPEEASSAASKSIFRYEIYDPVSNKTYSLGKKLYSVDTVNQSDKTVYNEDSKEDVDFADLINYDINVRFYGRFDVMMDMQAIFQLYANIGTYDRNIPIRYTKRRNQKEPVLSGDILVKEGSQLNFWRTFKTKGIIFFPTGSISNPGINLEANYTGINYSSNKTYNYTVKIIVTGTKNNPNIKLTYSIDGEEPKEDSTQVTKDALSLLLVGRTFKESGNGINLSDIANDAIYSGLSAGGSYLLNELFSGTGFIRNADIDLTGGIKEARLKLTGQLFGLGIEAGGTIADLASNSQISFILPLSSLLNLSSINFNAQFTGTINPNTSQSSEQKDWEFKMNIGKRY